MRGFLRYCLQPSYGLSPKSTVGDFGAGGGQYSAWLNDTGFVEALAYDSTMAVGDITGGAVQEVLVMRCLPLKTSRWTSCKRILTSKGDSSGDSARFRASRKGEEAQEWVMCLDLGALLPKQKASRITCVMP